MTDLLRASGTELARRIRDGQVTALQVVRAHVDRVRAVQPCINAVIADRFDAALAEAAAADRRQAREGVGGLPPFHGVPCTIKAAFALQGMPWDVGLRSREGVVATADAPAVAALRSAGCIPLGLTNVPEGLMWFETYNALHGRTSNPYDPRRIPGGSSGGEGAVIGAGGSPFGLGSDVAGSIRLPAFFCGVFGHKPSGGRVTCAGQYPPTDGERARFLASGPLARRAEDLLPLLRLIADPAWRDDTGHPRPLERRRAVEEGDLRGLRVLVADGNGRIPVSRDVKRSIHAAADVLARLGAAVEVWRHPAFRRSLELWLGLVDEAGGWSFSRILGDGTPVHLGRELLRKAVGASDHSLPSLALCLAESASPRPPYWLRRFADEGRALKADLDRELGDDGVLLHPAFPRTAMRHRVALLRPYEFAYTALFNVLRLPVTSVPLGLDRRGLPLGTQVAGAEGRDSLTIAVARALERELGGWVPPAIP